MHQQPRNRPAHLTLAQGKVINALRAGSLTNAQLADRFGDQIRDALVILKRRGYVESRRVDAYERIYRATPAGLAAVPPRSATWEPTL